MSTARKYGANQGSTAPLQRNGAYAALNIMWKAIAAQNGCFSASDAREARLEWITAFLGLKRELKSATELSDEQLRQVLGELRRLTGEPEKTRDTSPTSQRRGNVAGFATSDERKEKAMPQTSGGASGVTSGVADNVIQFPTGAAHRRGSSASGGEVEYLSANEVSEEQEFTIGKLFEYLGWGEEGKTDFLLKRKFPQKISALSFKKAHSLTMLLLNIAAHKDLKKLHGADVKISRQMTAKYIPTLKRKLNIDQ